MKYIILWVPLAVTLCITGPGNPHKCLADTQSEDYTHQIKVSNSQGPGSTVSSEPSGTITIEWALAAAMNNNPSLAASMDELKSKQGAEQQAGLYPNPVLFGEIEEFGGSGDFSGTDAMSSRIGISQEFLLGGKITKRKNEANAATRMAGLERLSNIIEIRTLVQQRFFEVFTLQERTRLFDEQLDLIRKTHEVVVKRVKTGDTSPMDLVRSQVELASAELKSQKISKDLESARYVLAETWGADTPVFSEVSAQFQPTEDYTEKDLKEALEQSPAWRLLEEEVALAEAAVDLAKAQRIPDIELEGGVQHFNESSDQAYFMGISIPLPLFDRNQGGIAEAKAVERKTRHQKDAGFLALHTELQQIWRKLISTRQMVESMERELFPAAQQAYDAMIKAYKAGETDILALLDAQSTWVETRNTRLDLLHELEISSIELKRLVGGVTASFSGTSLNRR